MHKRWASAFTIVELIIIIVVIAIIAATVTVGYSGVQKTARIRAAQSDLVNVAAEMERIYQRDGSYPTSFPSTIQASAGVDLVLQKSGSRPYYMGLSAVQNGTLLAQICSDLLAEGVGKGTDQGGNVRDYVSGCGNWNDDSMQVTAWDTKTWPTPVTESQLRLYANEYTVSNAYHKASQELAVKNFYTQLADRLTEQGGTFPVTSFWDYWATPTNFGVMPQPLTANPQIKPFYCASAAVPGTTAMWHITQTAKLEQGSC